MVRGHTSDEAKGRFRERLEIDFDPDEIETQQELGILMRDLGYRRFTNRKTDKIEKGFPTQPQLNLAWDILKAKSVKMPTMDSFTREKINKRDVFRANKDQKIGSKEYKKGQFIPKRK